MAKLRFCGGSNSSSSSSGGGGGGCDWSNMGMKCSVFMGLIFFITVPWTLLGIDVDESS